jgi:hypothetical protein
MTSSCPAPVRRFLFVALTVVALAVLAVLVLSRPASAPAAACPSGALAGVERPTQLIVLDKASPCRTGVGVVRADHSEHDGDCHVNVKLDAAYTGLLNATNKTKAGGLLITEVIPKHRVTIPRIGSRVRIVGTWVHDKATGWNELHPVWSMTVLSVGTGGTGSC